MFFLFRKFRLFLVLSILFTFYSCKVVIPPYQYEASCAGLGQGRTKRVLITTVSDSRKNLSESAKKDVLHALIFKGIPLGSNECTKSPIIPIGSKAIEDYKVFFNDFFSKLEIYSQFIEGQPQIANGTSILKRSQGGYSGSYFINVDYDALVKYLEAKGVSRSLINGM